jgi:hypothetical protein
MTGRTGSRWTKVIRERADDAVIAIRLARDLRSWLRDPVTLDGAKSELASELGTRAERFLAILDRAVLGNPRSPYAALLRNAGCTRDDVAEMVDRDGLEQTLRELAARGVYVTFDELKGRVDAIRGSARFRFDEADFDNPLIVPHYVMYSGGSGGRPTRVRRSLGTARENAADQLLAHSANGYSHRRRITCTASPVQGYFMSGVARDPTPVWLRPSGDLTWWVRLGIWYFAAVGWMSGYSFPREEVVDPEDAWGMAQRALAERRHGDIVEFSVAPSRAVRIADAAIERGVSLDGIVFQSLGEAMTPARRERLEASGGKVITHYGSRESGVIGMGCARPNAADDVHLLAHRHALITRARPANAGGPTVAALLLTSLSHNAAKLLLNAELGDVADIEQRHCGCLLGDLGLTTHLTNIRSFEKLTGHGVTFASGTLVDFVEKTLPSLFGGSALDYQLAEEERQDSTAQLVLRIHPGVGIVDERAALDALVRELAAEGVGARLHAELLRSLDAIAVRREPPLASAGGKVLPFHLVRQSTESAGV